MISRETWRTHRAVAAALGLAVACGSGHRSESLDPGGANGTLDGGGNGTDGGASSGKMTFGSGDGGSAGFSVTIEGPSQGALSVLASSCAGDCDDVTASAVGGVPPYTYAWSDGVKGASRHLCPTSSTTLTVTATDASMHGGELSAGPRMASAALDIQCQSKPATAAIGCPPLAVGAGFACAITQAGGLKCWGDGFGGMTDSAAPTDVVGLTSGVACVAAGEEHACALTTAGAVKCWGNDSLNGTGWGPTPVDIPGLSSGVVQIASGELDTCALLTDGSVKCWGTGGELEGNSLADLLMGGGGLTNYGQTPQTISGVPVAIKGLQMADGFGCFLTAGDAVQCWGGNTFGELGNGTNTQSATPVPVTGLGSGVTWLSANGSTGACAVVTGGRLKCWGQGSLASSVNTPTDVPGLTSGVVSVSVGGEASTCVIMTDGSVQCWETGSPPTVVTGISSAVYVATNEGCSCALLSNRKIMCWRSCPGSDPSDDAGNADGGPVEVQGL